MAKTRPPSDLDLESIGARFRVLSAPVRLAMLHAMQGGRLTVANLAQAVGTSQPNVSKHLRVLVEAGFVERSEEGATTWCRILDSTVFRLCELVCEGDWSRTGTPVNRSNGGRGKSVSGSNRTIAKPR